VDTNKDKNKFTNKIIFVYQYMPNIDIIQVLIITGIVLVLFQLLRESINININNDPKSDTIKDVKKTREPYAPNIDQDFNQFAPIDDPYYYPTPSVGWLSRRGLLPWWNSTRDTSGMSYDIRGDIPPFRYPVGPWLNSPVIIHPLKYREIY